MDELNKYLDLVKAEDKLKENTKEYVRNAYANRNLENTQAHSRKHIRRIDFTRKRLLGLIASVVLCMAILGGGYTYNLPVSYLSIDINPSVELGINIFNRVISAEGINIDGQALLQENKLRNMRIEKAAEILVEEAAEQGHVAANGSTVIAFTALSDNEEKAMLLEQITRDQVQLLLHEQGIDAIIYTDRSSLKLREQARQLGLSGGKFRLIALLQIMDPGISVEQYRNVKVTDIIIKANELLELAGTGALQSGEYEKTRTRILVAAQKIQQKNTNMLQTQNTTMNLNQTQNLNQYQYIGEQQPNQTQNIGRQQLNQNLNQSIIEQEQVEVQQGVNQNTDDSGSQNQNTIDGTGGNAENSAKGNESTSGSSGGNSKGN